MRRLSLVFGHSIFSVSTVLTTFMSGLALGSYLGGRWADRQRRSGVTPGSLLRTYGRLELFIGLWALLSLVLLNLVEAGFLALSQAGHSGIGLTAFLFGCSFLVLLPPTTAMGATLPVFTQVLVWRRIDTGAFLSKIYGLNTLGACTGAAVGGLFALPFLGLIKTVLATAFVNTLIAALAWSLAPGLSRLETELVPSTSDPLEAPTPPGPSGGKLVPFVFGLSGFAGMVFQIGWTRALVLSIGSSTYSFTIILMTFLASLGLGSILYKRLFATRAPRLSDLSILQLSIACSSLLVTMGMGRLPMLKLLTLPAMRDSFLKVAAFDTLIVFLVLLLPTLALGLTFPLVTHLDSSNIEDLGRRLGEAYAANTTGAILGSFLGGFVLLPYLGLQYSIGFAACLNLVGGVLLLVQDRHRTQKRWRTETLLGIATIGLLLFSPPWDLGLISSGAGIGYQGINIRPDPIFYRDGVTSTVTVGLNAGFQPFITVNGKADASLLPADRGTQLLLGLVPAALHPEPKNVAVVGFGSGQTLVGLLSVPGVQSVRCAELEPAVLEAKKFFAPFSEGAFDDPRLRLEVDDGRSFILGSPEKFDLIVSEPSNPWIAGIGNLYTQDFYRGCRRQLNENGIMGQWFHLYAMSETDIQMVYRTFFSVFPAGAIYRTGPGDILLIGAEHDVEFRPQRLEELFAPNAASADWLTSLNLVTPKMVYSTYLANRSEVISYLDTFGEGNLAGPINTDDQPLLEFRAPLSLYTQDGIVSEAYSHFTSIIPQSVSHSAQILQAAILGRLVLNLPFDAQTALTKIQKLDPEGETWLPALTVALCEGRAVDFSALIASAPASDKEWLTRFAIIWKLKTQDRSGLSELLGKALKPGYVPGRLGLTLEAARVAAELGDIKLARELYEKAKPLTQGDTAVLEEATLGSLPDWDQLLLEKSTTINPYNGRSRFLLAMLLEARGQDEDALRQAEESYRLYPHNQQLLKLLVGLHRKRGDAAKVLYYAEQLRIIESRIQRQ